MWKITLHDNGGSILYAHVSNTAGLQTSYHKTIEQMKTENGWCDAQVTDEGGLSASLANAFHINGWYIGYNNSHAPIQAYTVDDTANCPSENQELKVHFYPTNNVDENQQLKVEFYPTNNITNINQQIDIKFFPDSNVSDQAEIQELKVMFYPDGNVDDVVVGNTAFKWWFGMKGKKKYGNSKVRRIKLW